MITTDYAIELLKRVRGGDLFTPGWDTLEAFDMAIEALGKQVPMKPLSQEMDIDGRAITPCGFCGEALPQNVLYDFCPFCGQAIDRMTKRE